MEMEWKWKWKWKCAMEMDAMDLIPPIPPSTSISTSPRSPWAHSGLLSCGSMVGGAMDLSGDHDGLSVVMGVPQ